VECDFVHRERPNHKRLLRQCQVRLGARGPRLRAGDLLGLKSLCGPVRCRSRQTPQLNPSASQTDAARLSRSVGSECRDKCFDGRQEFCDRKRHHEYCLVGVAQHALPNGRGTANRLPDHLFSDYSAASSSYNRRLILPDRQLRHTQRFLRLWENLLYANNTSHQPKLFSSRFFWHIFYQQPWVNHLVNNWLFGTTRTIGDQQKVQEKESIYQGKVAWDSTNVLLAHANSSYHDKLLNHGTQRFDDSSTTLMALSRTNNWYLLWASWTCGNNCVSFHRAIFDDHQVRRIQFENVLKAIWKLDRRTRSNQQMDYWLSYLVPPSSYASCDHRCLHENSNDINSSLVLARDNYACYPWLRVPVRIFGTVAQRDVERSIHLIDNLFHDVFLPVYL